MLMSFSDLRGYSIRATDGELGSVKDVYFTDLSWIVRYVVVDTGHWLPGTLPGRKVLLSAEVLQQPIPQDSVLSVDLPQIQVEQSPGIEADQPVSRQHEIALADHYRWPAYWGERLKHGAEAALQAAHATGTTTGYDPANPCLRSATEVSDYHVDAADGEIGHVEDYIIDTAEWQIRYFIIDTKNWWPGKKVLVSPRWIKRVDWVGQKVSTDLPREVIKSCPTYDPREPIDRDFEGRLHAAVGQPEYWKS
jgi:hypothetical protein